MPDGNLSLAVNFASNELRKEYSQFDISSAKRMLNESQYYFYFNQKKLKVPLLDLEVSSSLVNFKNLYLKIEKTTETLSLKILDEIHLELAN